MGCEYCTSGLGENCAGPLGLDDLEAGCGCPCHECTNCGSAYCRTVGGPDPCTLDGDGDEW